MKHEKSEMKWISFFIPMAVAIGLVAAGVCAAFALQNSSQHKVLFEKAKFTMETKGDLKGAIELFEEIIKKYPNERDYAAKSLYLMGTCYEKLGEKQAQQAREMFQRIVQDYPDQTESVNLAKEKLSVFMKARGTEETGEGEFRIRKIGRIETLGAPSPDGSLISLVDWNSGDLALYEVASGKLRRVTDKGSWVAPIGFAEESIFSPDGKSIAFNWFLKDRYVLRTIRIDGTGQRDLYGGKNIHYVWPCAWTPDGRQIVTIVTDDEMFSRIVLVSAADGTARTIKEFKSGGPGKLSLSPDGRWIAFAYPREVPWKKSSKKTDIFILAVDGSREVAIVAHPADDNLLGWTPDGRSVLFSSDRSGSWDGWIQRIENGIVVGDPQLVKRDFGDPKIVPMGFSRDGSFFYGIRGSHDDVYIASLDPATGGPAGRAEKAALHFEGSNAYPCWSPDGSQLAYTSFRSSDRSEAALCLKSMVSGEERDFYPRIRFFDTAAWFPDGKSLLLRGVEEDGSHPALYRFDPTKGDVSRLIDSDNMGGLHGPIVFQDQRIVYDLDDFTNSVFLLMSYDLETGQKKKILRGSSHQFLSYDISPDGRWLFYGEGGIKRMPAEGGEAQTLLELGEGEGINSIACSPDGRFIYFSKWEKGSSKTEACSLWRIPAEGGKPEKFNLTMDGLENLSFHPSGSRLAFNSWRFESEAWVMENFLPSEKARK